MKQIQNYFKYVSLILLLIILFLTFLLIKPYLITIASSFIIAYFFYPVYKRINRLIKNKSLSSLILIALMVIVILIPALFLTNIIIDQSVNIFQGIRSIDVGETSEIIPLPENLDLNSYIKEGGSKALTSLLSYLSDFTFTIPRKILNLFIMVFLLFYLFKDGKTLVTKIKDATPFDKKNKEKIFKHIKEVMDATLYGLVLTAIIQGLVGMIGFFIFDVGSPVLWGLVMIIASMIPYLGSALVWLPIALFKIFNQDFFNGFGILIYGIVIISLVDNLLRPMIIGRKARIHPAISLIGVVGGLGLFGFVGIILGPVLLVIFLALFEIFLTEVR